MKEQQSLLDLYVDYLISSFSYTTATGLSRLVDEEISHDTISRLLSGEAFGSSDLWHIAKPYVRKIESEDGVLILDDSIGTYCVSVKKTVSCSGMYSTMCGLHRLKI